MKSIAFVLLATIVLFLPSAAQDTTTAAKIDTMLIYQKAIMEAQQKIYEEVHYVEPLANKTFGVELNLARLLLTSGQDYPTLTGTFSLFAVSRSAEIAFPFYYQHGTKKTTQSLSNTTYEVPLTLINLDATYRYFLGKHQDGFYFSAGMRYTYIKGVEGSDIFIFNFNQGGPQSSTSRFGAYFGIGYRYFTKSGFYWGFSLIAGRYFGKSPSYQEVLSDDTDYIIDTEGLKFGFAF